MQDFDAKTEKSLGKLEHRGDPTFQSCPAYSKGVWTFGSHQMQAASKERT